MLRLNEAIAERVKEILDDQNKKPYFLVKYGGIPRSTVSNLLHFKNNNVSTDLVYQICSVLEIDLKTFFDSPLFYDISN